jgi:cell division protein FtsB
MKFLIFGNTHLEIFFIKKKKKFKVQKRKPRSKINELRSENNDLRREMNDLKYKLDGNLKKK